MNRSLQICLGNILFCIGSVLTPAIAQPSGGPYGPIMQRYELPSGANKIYYVAADGKFEASGETLADPTSLEAAIERVRTGDAIVMRGGTYRTGNLLLNQGVTIQPYEDEQPVLKGTYVASEWQNLGNGLWVTKWSHLFPSKPDPWWQRDREGKKPHYISSTMIWSLWMVGFSRPLDGRGKWMKILIISITTPEWSILASTQQIDWWKLPLLMRLS